MTEIMANYERSYLVCNVTKNVKKHIQLYQMIKETIILSTNTCQTVL